MAPRRRKRGSGLFAGPLLAVVLCGSAQAAEIRSAYRVSFRLDVPLLLITGGISASYLFMNEGPPSHCAPVCDRADVNPLDRPFAGLHDQSWRLAGHVALASVFALIPAVLFAAEPSLGGLSDFLVVGETVLLAASIQVLTSYAVERPRPYLYGEEAPLHERTDPNARRSFFSGHVADALAATMVTALAVRRAGHPRLGWATLAVGVAGSALAGIARVASGAHFPTDVLAGCAVGAGVAIAVPAMHDLELEAAPLALAGARGLTIAGSF